MQISRNARALLIALVLLVCGASSAVACRVAPGPERTEHALRLMIDRADYIVIASVSHVLRRRWGEDDTRPRFHPRWIEHAEKRRAGEDIGSNGYVANWVDFAEAVAYLDVEVELYATGGQAFGRQTLETEDLLPIDLLRPFAVAGHGRCFHFPQTCPWDVRAGEHLALAVWKSAFGPHKALICRRIPRPTSDEMQEIRRLSGFTTKFDAIRSYLPDIPSLGRF